MTVGNSNANDFASSYNIILSNDGTGTSLQLVNGSALLNASGAGAYDGILTSFTFNGSTSYFKQVGTAPSGFVGNTIASNSNAAYGTNLVGPVSLSSGGTLPIILADFSAVRQ